MTLMVDGKLLREPVKIEEGAGAGSARGDAEVSAAECTNEAASVGAHI
jgi:hypothetical protein